MKNVAVLLLVITTLIAKAGAANPADSAHFFRADNANIQYTGRIDFTNPLQPKFWAPGVCIKAKFTGTYCAFIMNDEVLYGNSHNYLEIVIDDHTPIRIQTTGKSNTIKAADSLPDTEHTITICKNTESGIGYLEFIGFKCRSLMPLPAKPLRKIEFIGNSITCGTGSDLSVFPCGTGQWYDQHNAYLSYGPTVARSLNAQWHLSAVSGIGLIHSCCNMTVTMPQVFDKVNMRTDSIRWDFTLYQPDVVTITLGQNDGVRDSTDFCGAYVAFIKTVRADYPNAHIICLTSPMGNAELTAALQNYLRGIVSFVNNSGDDKVHKFYYSKQYHNGCGDHPDLAEHQQIAAELVAYIKDVMKW